MDDARRAALEAKIARLPPEKQQLLRARLGGNAVAATVDDLQPGLGGTGDFALSETQLGFWFLEQLEPGSPMFHLPIVARAHGELEVEVLRRAVEEVMRRHDLLRARVLTDGSEPRFRVDPEARLPFDEIDLGALADEERTQELRRLGGEALRKPFDFGVGPLLRLLVAHEKPQRCVIFLILHHLICDGWSVDLLLRELRVVYGAFSTGAPSPLPELRWRYADYVAWQRRRLVPERLDAGLDYWRRALDGAPPLTELPLDRPRPPIPDHEGGLATIVIGREDAERVAGFGKQAGLTPFMIYFGAFAALLARWSAQDEVVIGTATFNRPRAEFEEIVGLFINTLVLRCEVAGNPSARAYLTETVRKRVLDAFAHQDVPFNRVVRAVKPVHGVDHSPLFQVLFTYQNFAIEPVARLGDVVLRELAGLRSKATYELTVELHDRQDGGITAHAEFSAELFDRSTIVRLLHQLASLLYALVDDPEVGVQSIPLLSAAERRQVVVGWNQTEADFPAESTYPELFRAVARRWPTSVAAREGGETLTYAELDTRSDALAAQLAGRGAGRDTLMPLVQERGLALLTSIVAVLKTGAAWVPIDPHDPPERIERLMRRARAPVTVCEPAPSSALAYCIFTSGSTGEPKGALVEQRGMLNHMYAKIGELGLSELDVIAGTASPCFDISVWQFLSALLVGGRVVFFDDETTHSPTLFLERLVAEEITVAEIVPSFLRALLAELEQQGDRRPSLSRLRWLLLTGEALPSSLCNRWLELYPEIPLVNAYGPTECSDDVTHCVVRAPLPPGTEIVPIGRPIANTRIYVVDRLLAPVPLGVRGEIVVGGVGVGRGYLGDPERTRAVFVDDPFVPGPGNRLYRTGDHGRFRADGTLEFLGRIDHQVKIRGFRIEPGEVEAVLARHPDLREAAVLARADHGSELRLVAYVVARDPTEPAAEALRDYLHDRLPDYMIPAVFVPLAALPLTPNGKLDRAALGRAALGRAALGRSALPSPRRPEAAAGEAPAAPNDLEQVLAAIYAEVLGCERVGLDDDFFDLGGHSILAIDIVQRLQRAFKLRLALRQFLDASTVSRLAKLIGGMLHDGVVATPELADLEREAELDDAVRPSAPPREPARPRRVLLTGATGFLGSYLLRDLLEHTGDEVHCLVRAESEKEALGRIRAALESRSLWQRSFAARIVPVPGDLALPKLGQTRRRFDALAEEIDVVYHNAAWVNLLYSYANLRETNVAGTREVLRLATAGHAKPVHHVSTLAVFHPNGSGSRRFREDDEPAEIGVPPGGYAQTKWVAEKMVKTARARGLPVSIYRPPAISWHSRTGDWNPDDLLCQLVRACVALGAVPQLDRQVWLTPVDYVSRAIVDLSLRAELVGRDFHLVNPQPVHYADVFEWISGAGRPLERTSRDDWQARLLAAARRAPQSAWYPLAYLMAGDRKPVEGAGAQPGNPAPVDFDCSNTEAALAGTPVRCPPASPELVEVMVEKWISTGLGGRPGIERIASHA